MKIFKIFTFCLFAFFFQKIQAQHYEFLTNDQEPNSSSEILLNKDSMFFLVLTNNNSNSDFDIKIFNQNKYLNHINYKYSAKPNQYFIIYNSIILNDTTIILGGVTDMVDKQEDPFIIILDACLKPKKIIIFNEPTDGNVMYSISKMDDKRALLTIEIAKGNNDFNSFIPFNIKTGLLELDKRVTLETDFGINKVIDGQVFYYGSASRNRDTSTGWRYLKTHLAKYDTAGNLFWEKLYVLDDNEHYYSGKDFTSLQNPYDFLVIMNDRQPNKANPLIDPGVRVTRIDSAFNIVWDKIISDTTEAVGCYRILKINENRFLINGGYYPLPEKINVFCAKLYMIDSNGVVLATRTLKCGNAQTENFVLDLNIKMELSPDGDILLAGTYFDGQKFDAYFVKLRPDLSIAQQKTDNRVYYNACGEAWKDTVFDLPDPEIIVLSKDSFTRTPAPLYSVGSIKTASIEKTKTGKAVGVIYPNPTSDFLEFYSEGFKQINEVNFEIYNNIGQLVLSKKQMAIKEGKFTIDVRELTAGNYHLKVSGKEQIVNFKFVVE